MDFIDRLTCVDRRTLDGPEQVRSKSPVHYSKRNIKCGNFDVIWAKHDKPMSLIERGQQAGKGNEEEQMDLLPVVIYDQLPVYLQIHC